MTNYDNGIGYNAFVDGKNNDFIQDDELVNYTQKGDFHIGQSYSNETCKTISCKKCGASSFIVGSGDYFTAIKCKECGWELCIHDG